MRSIALVSALLIMGSALPAAAQTATAGSSSTTSGSTTSNPSTPASPGVMAKIKSDLEQAGYTNVNVTAAAVLATAKDKSGMPVTMIIGPHSFTEVVPVPGTAEAGKTNSSASGTQKK